MNDQLFVAVVAAAFCAAWAAPAVQEGVQPQDLVKVVDPPLVVPIQPNPNPMIIGGVDVDPRGKYPWQVSLHLFGKHVCGGSIIGSRTIITAAHCVDYRASWYKVIVGLHKQSETNAHGVATHSVQVIKRHEYYMKGEGNYPNDIAIMHLHEPITFNEYTQPIVMETEAIADSDAGYDDEECVISGWGYTSVSPRYKTPDVLQETGTKILSNDDCKNEWGSRYIAKGHVCIMDGESSACMGDSGGPLVCRKDAADPFRLIGVTSWGSSRCALSSPGVYTRVGHYKQWLSDKIL